MKSALLLLMVAVLAVIFLTAPSKNDPLIQSQPERPSLPAKLDSLFPPLAGAPLFLIAMHELATPFTGIMVDLEENDFENASRNYEEFKCKYLECSKMVPAWEAQFPLAPIEELGAALKSGDQTRLMQAFEQAGQTCHSCHITNMPLAQFKYHWDDFDRISVTDPLSGRDLSFAQMMLFLEASFAGVGVDLKQAQINNARKQMQGFAARFEAVAQSCQTCHDSERKYYVDDNIKQKIARLQSTLEQPAPDMQTIGQVAQEIGNGSCLECHLVHIPAAYAKAGWKAGN